MTPDFYLITNTDIECTEAVYLEREAWAAAQEYGAVAIFKCCPDDGVMRDVTEDCALAWFENWTVHDGLKRIPDMFLSHLESLAQDRMNAAFDPKGEMTRADDERDAL